MVKRGDGNLILQYRICSQFAEEYEKKTKLNKYVCMEGEYNLYVLGVSVLKCWII